MRALPLLLLLASCDTGMEVKDKEYSDWQVKNVAIEHVARATPATEAVTITIDSTGLAKAPDDWIELNVNGIKIARTPVWSPPGKPPIACRYEVKLAPNVLNWVRGFVGAEKKGWAFQADPRVGRTLSFSRGADGEWAMHQAE